MKKILVYTLSLTFAIIFLSCSKEEIINDNTNANTEELNFELTTDSTEPTIRYEVKTNLIRVNETRDCFTYQVNHILKTESGMSLTYSVIMHSGSGCKTEGTGLATDSEDGTGIYKGDIILRDYKINRETMVSLWESEPDTYEAYVRARSEMLAKVL